MVSRICLIVLMIAAPVVLCAQLTSVRLSERHVHKLNSLKHGHQRMVRYHRYYKRDSARQMRDEYKRLRKKLDSVYKANEKSKRDLECKLSDGHWKMIRADTVQKQIHFWCKIVKDSSVADTLRAAARAKAIELAAKHVQTDPGFEQLTGQYQVGNDTARWQRLIQQFPGLDTLSELLDGDAGQRFSDELQRLIGHQKVFENISGSLPPGDKLQSVHDGYKNELLSYADFDNLKADATRQLSNRGADYFRPHVDKITNAQASTRKLLGKYQAFTNSLKTDDALRRTSLRGRPLIERLVFAPNFNIVGVRPVCVDVSPQLGYRLNTRVFAGISMNFRVTFSDSIPAPYFVSPHNGSVKAFANYDVIKNFFMWTEFEKSRIVSWSSSEGRQTQWKHNYFAGAGRKFLVHPKLYLNLMMLYNFNDEQKNPVHPRRFQARIGFQVSELATRKRGVHYHPDR